MIESRLESLKQLTLLYVEEEAIIRAELTELIGHYVARWLTANNGQEGLEIYQSQRPDVVLTDIRMPIMDGLVMAEAIKALDRNTPVIFITSFEDIQYLQHAIELGADGYVLKPIDPQQLMRTLLDCAESLLRMRELIASRAQLAVYHQSVEQERLLVADIMAHMMRPEKLTDNQIRYWLRPTEFVGGDLIAVARHRNNKLYVMLADSTGHGLPAMLNLLPINHIFYSMVNKGLPVTLMVEEMNWAVREQSPTERYVAALVACIDTRNRIVEVWNGGLPGAWFMDQTGGLSHCFMSHNLPLGILDHTFTAETDIYQWSQPGQLIIYSDGLEDIENETGQHFSRQNILTTLQNAAPEQRVDALIHTVDVYRGTRHAFDDMSLIIVESARASSM